jgi:Holliday junction resolvase-like predicted endonuclease
MRWLASLGWTILGCNVRMGRDEVDIVALDPGPDPGSERVPAGSVLVTVEVRSRSGGGFGAAEESVDSAKVARLYRATAGIARVGRLPDGSRLPARPWRVDLVTVGWDEGTRAWRVARHLRGLAPP